MALVAGATRGAGRAIAIELGAAGATVYLTGRSTRSTASPMRRPETIEETEEMVSARGASAVAVRVDHTQPAEVMALFERVRAEQSGRLDVLVNDVWGGDPLSEWGRPFWELSIDNALEMQRLGVHTHLVTSRFGAPLLVAGRSGLIVEMTDGAGPEYRGNLPYDLAKASVQRLALAQAEELRPHQVAAVALTPGFMRSEAVLDHLGVREENWRDGIVQDPHFAASETPFYVGRAVVALASDPRVMRWSGRTLASWDLAREYGFTDVDGGQPDWGRHYRDHVLGR